MNVIDKVKELLAAASSGPWRAAVFTPGDGTGQVVIYDVNDHPIFFVVDQNSNNAQLAALARDLVQALVESQEALSEIGHGENTSYLACPGPPHCDKSHYPTCPVQIARAALRLTGLKEAMER